MSATEEPVWDGRGSYHVIAWANGQKVLSFERFGSYSGEWLMLTKDAALPLLDGQPAAREPTYYVYKDYYGSCSICDAFQAEDEGDWTLSKAKEFAADYKSFIEIPRSTMINLIDSGGLRRLFPAHIRDNDGGTRIDDMDFDSFVIDTIVAVKLEENLDVSAGDVLCCRNQEIKQAALRRFGYERFVAEANMTTLDAIGDDKLIGCGDVLFASVKDSSTDRRYLLRVPPQTKRLKEAVAWTFNLREKDYHPLIET